MSSVRTSEPNKKHEFNRENMMFSSKARVARGSLEGWEIGPQLTGEPNYPLDLDPLFVAVAVQSMLWLASGGHEMDQDWSVDSTIRQNGTNDVLGSVDLWEVNTVAFVLDRERRSSAVLYRLAQSCFDAFSETAFSLLFENILFGFLLST